MREGTKGLPTDDRPAAKGEKNTVSRFYFAEEEMPKSVVRALKRDVCC